MSKTLLDAVNETLKRVNIIAGNQQLLTSLVSSPFQHNIDVAVQVINEGIDELYTSSATSLPQQQKEATITLVLNQREYTLASDMITMHYPPIDRTNTQFLFEWTQGYDQLLLLDPQQLYTGLPTWCMISPITGALRVERAPDAPSAGRVYTYEYDRNLVLVNATDAIPFNDQTFRAMVPMWAQLYKREMQNEFDTDLYTQGLGRASRSATEHKMRKHWSPRG